MYVPDVLAGMLVYKWLMYADDNVAFCLRLRYPSQHVYCSEQSLSGRGQSAQDKDPDSHEQEQDSTQNKVCGWF